MSKRSTLLRRARAKEKVKRINGPEILPREAGGRAHRRMWRAIASRGRSLKKQEEPSKGPSGGKAKGKGKGLKCYVCGGIGHPARLCSSEGWVNDLEQDAPAGGCWTDEDDETLQLGYFGSDSCLMSSPPGLRDAFNEAGWTVMTRKSRNRQQGSRRRGCSEKRGMVLGSLWDDDSDMILEQVADDRTKNGMMKISAVVDSGAEANVVPREHDALDSTEAQFGLKVRKDLPRRRERSHPCAR